jgi:hypothetical protein
MSLTSHRKNAPATVRALAARYGVAYVETSLDVLGGHITRLAGEDVALDETEQLLLALERAGHIGVVSAVRLHSRYLDQARAEKDSAAEVRRRTWTAKRYTNIAEMKADEDAFELTARDKAQRAAEANAAGK